MHMHLNVCSDLLLLPPESRDTVCGDGRRGGERVSLHGRGCLSGADRR